MSTCVTRDLAMFCILTLVLIVPLVSIFSQGSLVLQVKIVLRVTHILVIGANHHNHRDLAKKMEARSHLQFL